VSAGIFFGLAFLFAPQRGMVAGARRRVRQRWEFAMTMLAGHLLNHEGSPEAEFETSLAHMNAHLRWSTDHANEVVQRARQAGIVHINQNRLELTEAGRKRASQGFLSQT
jgi:manganese/zinc/iron transport system permease protein